MAIGKSEDFYVHDSERFGGSIAKPAISGVMLLSANSIDSDASIGDVLGTVSISAAYVGTAVWSLLDDGDGQFAIGELTGVVVAKSALNAGATSIRVKVKGTKPPIQATTFAVTVNASSYSASAVHFGGAASLHIASLTAPGDDTGFFASSFWMKIAGADINGSPLWVVDPENVYDMSCGPSSFAQPHPRLACTVSDLTGDNDVGIAGNDPDVGTLPVSEWVHVLMAVKTNFSNGNKIFQVYLNDQAYTFIQNDNSAAFLMTFTGFSFWVGDDSFGDFLTFDTADMWIAPGQFIDFSVESNRRKFIDADGKPVDLGADGSTPTGTAPAIFFSGDPLAFPTNKGTGGSFTLAGSLTNASTSPSD